MSAAAAARLLLAALLLSVLAPTPALAGAAPAESLRDAWRMTLEENRLEAALAAFESAASDPALAAEGHFGRALGQAEKGETRR